jgi:hypothetical protein
LAVHKVTKQTTGAVWVLRALHAVPTLQKVRLDSHAQVTEAQAQRLTEAFPGVPPKELALVGRIAIEMTYTPCALAAEAVRP